ncbi:MAG TPA: D-Ala-D-Ala carboxypeptidase family metallohydrolase [Dehalococcoidia bacterium]
MKLSGNFTLAELTATRTGLPNEPGALEEQKLLYLANYVLQPVRDRWGRVRISSGYRSPAVNIAAKGSSTSQHLPGEAADIVPLDSDIRDVYRWLVEESRIAFGQAIYETAWIHVSLVRMDRPNGEALVYDGRDFRKYSKQEVLR